jgi:Cu2+-exporting ATPase
VACGYGARAYDPRASEAPLADRRRAWLARLAVAGFGALATMFLAEPLYWQAPATAGADLAFQQALRWGGMVVGTATGFFAAGPFVRGAFARRKLGMDALVTLAVATTWLASLWGFFTHGAVYFDSLTMFMFLLVGARFAESTVRAQVLGAVERQLGDVPDTARLVRRGGLVQEVATALRAPGDVVRLRAGERVPADGVVVAGGRPAATGNGGMEPPAFDAAWAALARGTAAGATAGEAGMSTCGANAGADARSARAGSAGPIAAVPGPLLTTDHAP